MNAYTLYVCNAQIKVSIFDVKMMHGKLQRPVQ